jgi:hypothetical protein
MEIEVPKCALPPSQAALQVRPKQLYGGWHLPEPDGSVVRAGGQGHDHQAKVARTILALCVCELGRPRDVRDAIDMGHCLA